MIRKTILGLTTGLLANLLLGSCTSEHESPPKVSNEASKPDAPKATAKADAPKTIAKADAPKATAKPATGANAMPDKAPGVFKVKFKTTVGDIVIECRRAWSPKGADRFFELVKKGFYEEIAFFRVIPTFMAQFGIHGDPEQAGEWRGQSIDDDPKSQPNIRGMISFAIAGPNTRTTQMFINFGDNRQLDSQGFTPFAKVLEGMDVVDEIHQVGEGAPRGPGPRQDLVQSGGNDYLKKNFPKLTYIKGAVYLGESK